MSTISAISTIKQYMASTYTINDKNKLISFDFFLSATNGESRQILLPENELTDNMQLYDGFQCSMDQNNICIVWEKDKIMIITTIPDDKKSTRITKENWRQLFLESAGTIDIDEEAVDSLRKASMI